MDKKTRIAFLFGAGVEGKGNFDIEMGFDYLQKSILISNGIDKNEKFTEYLKNYWKGYSFFNATYKYTSDLIDAKNTILVNLIVNKCETDDGFKKSYEGKIKKILDAELYKNIFDRNSTVIAHDYNGIKDEIKSIITGNLKKYSDIKSSFVKKLFNSDNDDNIISDLNIGISGTLDSYFHTIINPKKYGIKRFSKIINYYWSCYFTILRSVLVYLYKHGVKDAGKYLCNLDNNTLDYKKILENLKEVTMLLYEQNLDYSVTGTYYDYINLKLKELDSKVECVGVITTNYYQFCSKVFHQPIFLNGQLKLFEYPELLEVVDITNDKLKENKIIFPFILGQSLVKPIINKGQIDEFKRLTETLNNTDVLIVFGFNINDDDNHINAFLHDFLKRGKILIVTNQEANMFRAKEKLKCDKNIFYCKVEYGDNSRVVNQIFDELRNCI